MVMARWQSTIVDDEGNVLPNAQVTVQREVAGAPLATIYQDRDGTIPLGNPFSAAAAPFAADGHVWFHAPGGAYRITAESGAFTRTIRYKGVGTASEYDLVDTTGLAVVQNVEAGYALLFETETSAPPSAGSIRFNNADLSAATEAYISVENAAGSDITAVLLDLFDAARTRKDAIIITDLAANTQATFQVDGAAADGSPASYVTLTISGHSGATAFSAGAVNLQRDRAGVDGGLFAGGEAQVVARSGDLVPFQDVSDSNNPKRGTAQSVAETARVEIELMPFDLDTDVETGDGAGGVFFRVPVWMNGFNITAVAAAHGTAGSGAGTTTIQLRNVTQAADILSTRITIESTETDSSTAATPAVINGAQDDLTTGDLIRVDIDAIPGSTAPAGLIVSITAERPAS